MASAPVVIPQGNADIKTATIEQLLSMAGQIESEMEKRLAAIKEEQQRKRARIQAILAEAGLADAVIAAKPRGRKAKK